MNRTRFELSFAGLIIGLTDILGLLFGVAVVGLVLWVCQ